MASSPAVEWSIVIPVYNEENNISECLRRIQAFMSLKSCEWEVLVADDGSADRTAEVVRNWCYEQAHPRVRLLRRESNRGKGAAVRNGVFEARGRIILMTDVDLSTPIKEADRLAPFLEDGYDIVIGSRALKEDGCDVQQSWRRRLAGRIFNFFVQRIAVRGFKDTQCGFKLFKNAVAKDLFERQKLDGFSFDVEILRLALKKGYRVKEAAVMWRQGRESRVSLWRDSIRMLRDLFYIRRLV